MPCEVRQFPEGTMIVCSRPPRKKPDPCYICGKPSVALCDWVAVDVETIERIGEAQGLNGPAELNALVMGLDWAETHKDAVICKHCRAAAQGKRVPVMGEPGGYA